MELLTRLESLQRLTLLVASREIDQDLIETVVEQVIEVCQAGGGRIQVLPLRESHWLSAERGDLVDTSRETLTVPVKLGNAEFGEIRVVGAPGVPLPSGSISFLQDVARVLAAGMHRQSRPSERDLIRTMFRIPDLIRSIDNLNEAVPVLNQAATALQIDALNVLSLSDPPTLVSSRHDVDIASVDAASIARSTAVQRAIEDRAIHVVIDVREAADRYQAVWRSAESAILYPVAVGGVELGVIIAELGEGIPVTRQHHQWIKLFSDHFSLLLSRDRLQGPVSTATRHVNSISEIVSIIDSDDRDSVLRDITDHIREVLGWSCSIGLLDGERVILPAVSCRLSGGQPQWLDEGIPLGLGIIGKVAATGETELLWDVSEAEHYIAVSDDVISEICVPILARGEVVGTLNAESHVPVRLTTDDHLYLETVARLVGLYLTPSFSRNGNPGAVREADILARISKVLSADDDPGDSIRGILGIFVESGEVDHGAVLIRRSTDFLLLAQDGDDTYALDPSFSVRADLIEAVVEDPDDMAQRERFVHEFINGDNTNGTRQILPLRRGSELLGALLVARSVRNSKAGNPDLLADIAVGHLSYILANSRTQDELKQLAALDPITEVPNHRFFRQKLARACRQARRDSQHLSLLVIDLDDFKTINDTYGHLVGDWLLRSIARMLTDLLRGEDLLARYAGDEFVALLVGADSKIADQVARRLVSSISSHAFEMPDGSERALTLSVGIATLPDDGVTSHDLLKAADTAMYLTKDIGKNGVGHHRDAANLKRGDLTNRF